MTFPGARESKRAVRGKKARAGRIWVGEFRSFTSAKVLIDCFLATKNTMRLGHTCDSKAFVLYIALLQKQLMNAFAEMELPGRLRGAARMDRYSSQIYSSQFENIYFTERCSGSESGSYLRLIDFCITQL